MCKATCLPKAPHFTARALWNPALLSVNMHPVSESILNTVTCYPGEAGALPTILVKKTYFFNSAPQYY